LNSIYLSTTCFGRFSRSSGRIISISTKKCTKKEEKSNRKAFTLCTKKLNLRIKRNGKHFEEEVKCRALCIARWMIEQYRKAILIFDIMETEEFKIILNNRKQKGILFHFILFYFILALKTRILCSVTKYLGFHKKNSCL
jgi:hypothetical protein